MKQREVTATSNAGWSSVAAEEAKPEAGETPKTGNKEPPISWEGLRQSPRRGPYKSRPMEQKPKKKRKGSRGRANKASRVVDRRNRTQQSRKSNRRLGSEMPPGRRDVNKKRESEREERPRTNQARETNREETPEREELHKARTRRRRRLRRARRPEKSANHKKTQEERGRTNGVRKGRRHPSLRIWSHHHRSRRSHQRGAKGTAEGKPKGWDRGTEEVVERTTGWGKEKEGTGGEKESQQPGRRARSSVLNPPETMSWGRSSRA